MAISSLEAQYLPSRYSSTNTGTFAPTLTRRHKILADHLAAEHFVYLVIQSVSCGCLLVIHSQIPSFTGNSSDWSMTASVTGSRTTTRTESQSSRVSIMPTFASEFRFT